MSLLCRNALVLPNKMDRWVKKVVDHGIEGISIGEVTVSKEKRKIKLFFKSNGLVPDELLADLSLSVSDPIVYRVVVDVGYYLVKIFKNGKEVWQKEKDVFFYSLSVA